MNALEMQAFTHVNKLVREIQSLPRDLIESTIKNMEGMLKMRPAGDDADKQIVGDVLSALRLALQWSNQAREQLLTQEEVGGLAEKVLPGVVGDMLKRRFGR